MWVFFFSGLYHVSLMLPSFDALFRHTQLLLRLRPFATLDLVRNQSQSHSNPQISEPLPSLNSLDFYCKNPITSHFQPPKPIDTVALQLQASYLSEWTNEFVPHHRSQGGETQSVAVLHCTIGLISLMNNINI